MARQDLKPIEHNKFIGAVDSEYTDAQDLPITALAKTTNLTQFRKIGALVQAPGTSFKVFHGENLSSASMPIIAGFSPIQFESFTIDRDEKEILLAVYKNVSNEIKMFIQPYWNPSALFSNHNPLKTAESWIYEWLEITEQIETYTVGAATTGNTLVVNETVTQVDHYFDKWFLVNHSILFDRTGAVDETKFNYVESQIGNTFTTKASVNSWTGNDLIRLVRFPVRYLYQAKTPNAEYPIYNGIGEAFKAVPTQYVKGLNQVRMPCGKENKPLVLDMIFKRNYLIGNDIMSYDGFWFDFQQPQQVLFKSAISSYGDTIGTASTTYRYFDPTDISTLPSIAPAANYIRIKYTGTTTVTLKIKGNVLGQIEALKYEIQNGIHIISIRGAIGSPSLADFKTFLDTNLGYIFEFTLSGTYASLNLNYNIIQSFVYGAGGISLGIDAGNNKIASNYFLGTQVRAIAPHASTDVGSPMIITAILDNRNEVILGHGNICTNPSAAAKGGFKLYLNCWFSRKITHIAIYNKASEVMTPSVFTSNQYPYFLWLKGIKINELPLLALISIYDPAEAINGEMPVIVGKSDYSLGYNSYKFDGDRWFIYINKDVNPIDVVGKGLKFIVRANRWIDQDITMNYTRMCFIGQTNGRFFVTNCKNIIEKEVFENNDLVLYSNFCAGISAYDIYTRDKNVAVSIGDKDTNVDLLSYKGYVMLIKQTNNYLINVKTGNELQYAIVDTMTGRGANDYNSICQTPYGVVICAKDSIYLLNNNSVVPLLTETNGRLKLYLDKFTGKQLQCQYYNDKNEVVIISTDNTNSRTNGIATILVYNFRYKFWTTYEYATSTNPIWTTIDHDKNILMLNYKDADNFNVAKMDESSSTFLSPYGTAIDMHWEIETHSVPYSNNLVDLELNWIDFIVNYTNSADRTLKVNMKFDDDINDITDYITLASSASLEKKNHLKSLLINPTLSRTLTLNVKNLSSNSVVQKFAYFSLNSFIYWVNSLQRKRQTN